MDTDTGMTGGTDQTASTLQARIDAADSFLVQGCQDGGCLSIRFGEELRDEFHVERLNSDIQTLAHSSGIQVVSGSGTDTIDDGTRYTFEFYGGWGEHNVFSMELEDVGPEPQVTAVSAGAATGSVPIAGSATWRGFAVAGEVGGGAAYRGDAALTVNFAASNVDTAFTNMRNVETGAVRESIIFDDVPLTSDGFRYSGFGGSIEGVFYGPSHAEAGGVFTRDDVAGSFGVTRQ